MKKNLIVLIMVITVLVPSVNSYALPLKDIGTYHKDGSYQLSKEELKRYNELDTNIKKTNQIISYAEAIQHISPYYYKNLSKVKKEEMHRIQFGTSLSNNQKNDYTPYGDATGVYAGTYASISKYGSSLKGYGKFERKVTGPSDPLYQYVYMINQIWDNESNTRIAASWNQKPWLPDSEIFISSTTIIDPPSGEYYDLAEFAIPLYDELAERYYFRDTFVKTSPISYSNRKRTIIPWI